jgi:hypothetical protein
MTRRQKAPLRPLTSPEQAWLQRIARSGSERADRVARAKALLPVAQGTSFTAAAGAAGRKSGDAVARFNQEGLAAVDPSHGGGPPASTSPRYESASWGNSSVPQTESGMARPPGLSLPCSER